MEYNSESIFITSLHKMIVAGCANMNPSDGVTLARRGNETIVECDSNGQTSTFRCNGTAWLGQLPNCTEQETPRDPDNGFQVKGEAYA